MTTETSVTEQPVKHTPTPGPWACDDVRVFAPAFDAKVTLTREDGSTVEHGKGLIALVYSCGPWDADFGSMEANQYLIAAAPELLDALKALARIDNGSCWCDHAILPGHSSACLKARAAIAKAEGRTL